jgi:hypothetical protein
MESVSGPMATLPNSEGDSGIEISVVVPVNERPEPLDELYEEYSRPLRDSDRAFEFLFVVVPWARSLTQPLKRLVDRGEPIRVLEVAQSVSQSALIKLGGSRSRGAVILTLPAYRRVEAGSLIDLLGDLAAGSDLVVARRWPRRDSWINRFQNRVFHGLVRWLVGGTMHDVACGVHAMRREVLEQVPLYGDFYRFLPLLAMREGYRVEEVSCPQHSLDRRARLYWPGVYLRRVIDVLGLYFLLRFTEKPLRFFGFGGSLIALSGAGLLLLVLVQRSYGQGLADRPLLLLGVMLVVLGVQSVALGLIGEIIVHVHAPHRRPYRLARASKGRPTSNPDS